MHAEPGPGHQPGVDVAELAGLDAGAQDGLDPALVLAAPQAELLGPGAGEGGELVQEDPHVIGVAVDDVEQLVAQHGQLLRRRPARIGHPVGAEHDLVHDPVVDGGQQLLLGADVVVERSLAQVVGRAELHDPGGVVTLAGEDVRRGVDDRLAPLLPFRAAPGVPVRLHAHECDASGNRGRSRRTPARPPDGRRRHG